MNKGFETPADPYVPGLEYSRQMALLLLRVGIAVEHPNDARRLRLVDFRKWLIIKRINKTLTLILK